MQSSRPGDRSPRLLPPLVVEGNSARTNSGRVPSAACSKPAMGAGAGAGHKLWSHYHRGCFAPHEWLNDTSKRAGNGKQTKQSKSAQPVPQASCKDADEHFLEYMEQNKFRLESYVINCVPLHDVERWRFMKLAVETRTLESAQMTRKSDAAFSTKDIFLESVRLFQEEPSESTLVCELGRVVASALKADTHRVFKLFPDNPNYVQYFVPNPVPDQPLRLDRADPAEMVLVLEAAGRADCWKVSRGEHPHFPDTPSELFVNGVEDQKEIDHIIYLPILTPSGKTSYVIELWRSTPYQSDDEKTGSNFMLWGSLALHLCNLYLGKKRERNMSDFLLDVVKAIFEEMVSLDQLIKRILEFAQRLVNADRASLFLVDYRNFELVSTVFDLKFEPGQARDVEKKEIRMPISRGIAGHVALSGETMNIPDAYSDYRFNREVDEATGYKTISILCMPIKVQGKVIGVVQMVNKRNDESFHHEDEVAFEIFSSFFGLALHHARLYDRIMRKEQKYKVALEVLSYHNTCKENEVQAILDNPETIDIDLNDFYLDPYKFNAFEKCKAVIKMFNDLFDISKFDIVTVTRFVLTVKKNYRTVPYHNFDHGWSVAQSMYSVLKNEVRNRYNYKMRLALFVACLCHDLDHRGYTNKYMSETASPLASMYTTSTLEHHHFNITVTILQQDGHNIFSHMTSQEYKDVLGLIRHCILATDLAAFFPNLAKMKDLCGENSTTKFSWGNDSHRELAMAISMTAADLSASAKPFHIQIKTVKVIFEEFYDQGDKERAAGRVPIPMMDRNKPDEQPDSQVGFLSQICIPCYKVLYRILPKTKPMYVMALKNLHNWKSKAERIRNMENYSENFDESEIEDVSEEILLQGEAEYDDDEEECDVENVQETQTSEVHTDTDEENSQEENIEEILRKEEREVLRRIEGESCWEEEDKIQSEEKIGGRLSKDIEGVTWIDEEGVIMRPNVALKGYNGNK